MNSDPKSTTSYRDPPAKTSRVVINLFLDPKMRSPLEVRSIEVMFSAHGDSVWSMSPPRTFSVGFEEKITAGVMFFTFADPKIAVKSLFPILYLKEKNNKPHIFTPPLPSGRGGVKIWGLLFFGYSQKFLPELVSLCSVQTPVSSRIKVNNPNDRSLKTLQIFIFTISDDT